MKAEQRKELETNTLADKMGQVMQNVKGGQRRTFIIYLIAAAAVLVLLWFTYNWWVTGRQESSWKWVLFYDGTRDELKAVLGEDQVGKSAKFQLAWYLYWEDGVKSLGGNKEGALSSIKAAGQVYKNLAEECKGDAILEPQAMLGQAVCEESLAVQDRKHLSNAKKLYEALTTHENEKYKDSAEAKYAAERLKAIKAGTPEGEKLSETYKNLQRLLNIPAAAPDAGLFQREKKKDE